MLIKNLESCIHDTPQHLLVPLYISEKNKKQFTNKFKDFRLWMQNKKKH